jgi:hypothetical protein
VEIATRRRPVPAIAAPAHGLHGGDNPKPSRVAGPGVRQGFVVGRSKLVVLDQPVCFILGRSRKTKQGKTTMG